eukprot:521928-Amphidinium_carterae.1
MEPIALSAKPAEGAEGIFKADFLQVRLSIIAVVLVIALLAVLHKVPVVPVSSTSQDDSSNRVVLNDSGEVEALVEGAISSRCHVQE